MPPQRCLLKMCSSTAKYGDGCMGAFPMEPGISGPRKVSGGLYDAHVGCTSYSIPQCEHHFNGSQLPGDGGEETLPSTARPVSLAILLPTKITSTTAAVSTMSLKITADIYKNGPVEGTFPVYANFLHVTNEMKGGHTICILDWRVQNATP